MARRHKHEEHQNHEAWAIPYGDLITLLLAFFVVMYAVSSVNEGKYRVLSDSLSAAFRGSPQTPEPIQLSTKSAGRGGPSPYPGTLPRALINTTDSGTPQAEEQAAPEGGNVELAKIAKEVEEALAELISQDLVKVRQHRQWLEIEIRTDILFASGDARVAANAVPVLTRVARILADLPNPLRVEGHTDNVPIRTSAYPSNWELSAARAASVVHLFMNLGVDPVRMEISGFGEYRPKAPNDTQAGRDQNRRVVIIVLDPSLRDPISPPAEPGAVPEAAAQAEGGSAAEAAAQPTGAAPSPAPSAPPATDRGASGG